MTSTVDQLRLQAVALARESGLPLPEALEMLGTATGASHGDVETRDERGRLMPEPDVTLDELLRRG